MLIKVLFLDVAKEVCAFIRLQKADYTENKKGASKRGGYKRQNGTAE